MTAPLADIEARIAAVADTLTPTERRISALLTDEPTVIAFATVATLAERIGTSGPTVVRFAAKLGFDGYGDLQASARRALADRLNTPTERIRHDATSDTWSAAHRGVSAAIETTFERLGSDRLVAMATPVARASGNVWIVASETSSPVAHSLAANLRLIRSGVRHLNGSTAAVAAAVVEAGQKDVVIAIDFERYERAVVATTKRLAAAGAAVIAVTDGPLSPLATIADHWAAVTVPAVGPFDSAVPVLAVIEALTAEVASQRRRDASARLDRIEQSWAAYGVFEPSDQPDA